MLRWVSRHMPRLVAVLLLLLSVLVWVVAVILAVPQDCGPGAARRGVIGPGHGPGHQSQTPCGACLSGY